AEKLELAAVVVGVDRVRDLDHLAAAARRRSGGAAALQFVDSDVPGLVVVIDVEAAALGVVGWEGDREQAALAVVEAALVADVEERPSEAVAAAQDRDPARLFDHEEKLRRAGGA